MTVKQSSGAKAPDGSNYSTLTDGAGNLVGGAGDPINVEGSLTSTTEKTATATLTNVDSGTSSVTLLAANTSRKGVFVFNDDANPCYIKYGATASSTSYTLQLYSGDFWVMDSPIYTGIITVIWAANGSGAARVTEL